MMRLTNDERSASMPDRTALPPALEICQVESGYDRLTVLQGVSLKVLPGQVVALLGPNGAGKTTVLRTISGLLTAQRGSIRVQGRDVTRERWDKRFGSGLCHIPEGRGVFRSLTVRENLALQAGTAPSEAALEVALSAFRDLAGRLDQRAGTLSGGQQQMLAMAAAHVRNPDVVMIDEASSGLSPILVDEVFEFIRAVARRGASVLLVDQFVHRALDVAQYVYVLRRGAVVASGPPSRFDSEKLAEHYFGAPANKRPPVA